MTKLIILRHGQSLANADKVDCGQTDSPLTELGHRQALLAADYLLARERIDRIYSSDLCRAYDSVLPVAQRLGLSVTKDPALREINTGSFAGHNGEELRRLFPEELRLRETDYSHMRFPEGEYVPEFYDRVMHALRRIVRENPNRCVLIGTHAGVVRIARSHAEGYSRTQAGIVPSSYNASLHIYEWENDLVRPVALNVTEHLGTLLTSHKQT